MKSGFGLIQDIIGNNKVSEGFLNRMTGLTPQDDCPGFDRVLSQRIAEYAPGLKKADKDGSETTDPRQATLNHLIDTIPTFLFRLVLDWNRASQANRSSRNLLPAVLSFLVWKDPASLNHIDALVNDIEPSLDIKALNARLIQKTEGPAPVPNLVFRDFLTMSKGIVPLPERSDLSQRIETFFCIEALFQFLLTYYFDLLCHAKTDTMTGFVHILFLRMVSAVKQQEDHFWNQYPEKQGMKAVLLDAVAADQPEQRHELLRLTSFKAIHLLNPLLDLTQPVESDVVAQRIEQRLQQFYSLSVMAMSLFLDSLLLLREKATVVAIMARLRDERKKQFEDFQIFLEGPGKKAHRSLAVLFQNAAEQQTGGAPDQTPVSAALRGADANQVYETEKAMSSDQIAAHLKSRLLKRYEEVRIEGALTQDQIGEYLASISSSLAKTLVKGDIRLQQLDAFAEKIEPEIREISSLGMLAQAEKADFLQQFQQQAEDHIAADEPDSTEAAEKQLPELKDPFWREEIVPIGFEKGAPRIPAGVFLFFPFAAENEETPQPFAQHLRYLEDITRRGMMPEARLQEIRNRLSDIPRLTFRKTYDVFPFDRFDESVLLVVYSLWRNGALATLLKT